MMATQSGAEILGRGGERGKLKKGMRADVIILDADAPNLFPVHNPESTVVYRANGNNVVTTIINGVIVMENRNLTTIDMEKVKVGVKKSIERMGI